MTDLAQILPIHQPPNALDVDVTVGIPIAVVSTKRPGAQRWTELRITYIPDASGRAFLAEVIGHSDVGGDVTRRRAIYVGSVGAALKHFDQESDASHAIANQAEDWLDRNGERITGDIRALRSREREMDDAVAGARQQRGGLRYTGSTLKGALAFLYGATSEGAASAQLERDFGVPARTVRDALKKESAGDALSGWVKAFIAAMMHFDRESFLAAKGATDADAG